MASSEVKMTDSQRLLAEYLKGSEPAFRELISRYLDLVYSTAIRSVNGDSHLAEDVAQTVFADLARMARTLASDVMLGGWLHRHTCFVAATVMRTERRRQSRERQALEMNALDDHSEANLAQVAPILDEAINQLGARDRTAILLRFFEQNDLRAVGEALGSSEDAAQKCVARALEKLRGLLKNRGVSFSATALGTVLTTQAVTAAPAGLVVTISGTALASAAASGATAFTLFNILTMTKLKLGIISAAVAVGVAVPLVIQQGKLRDENHALQNQVEQLTQRNAENESRLNDVSNTSNSQPLSDKQMSELLKLRGEIGVLRDQQRREKSELEALRTAAVANAKVPVAPPTTGSDDILHKESWVFAGYATPEAALQSWSWALLKGNANVALSSLMPEMRKTWEQEFQGKTDDELADEGARSSRKVIGYQILQSEVISDDEVILHLSMNLQDKARSEKPQRLKFQRINNEWKVAGPVSN